VTVHENPIDVNGWVGSGYLVIDPETGAGAYLISGGNNGGSISDILNGFSGWLLGMVDGGYGHLNESNFGKALFSNGLKYIQKMLNLSTKVGYFGLFAGIVSAFASNGLSSKSVGIASVGILAFALTAIAVTAIAGATGVVSGIIAGGAAAIAIAVMASKLSAALF